MPVVPSSDSRSTSYRWLILAAATASQASASFATQGLAALQSGQIGGAGLDVWDHEPPPRLINPQVWLACLARCKAVLPT